MHGCDCATDFAAFSYVRHIVHNYLRKYAALNLCIYLHTQIFVCALLSTASVAAYGR
ncbi:hypothetical protein V2W45_1224592 [Cenococcum geophilum]